MCFALAERTVSANKCAAVSFCDARFFADSTATAVWRAIQSVGRLTEPVVCPDAFVT
eukprot:CAMPEP_0174753676 /NCGR_PEP_ID=MMETSP1094-20130205/104510_1 /TAXON_ID=156173 /ORGANISM="Chrysochromulina brevifilum, Strain UTEX LB 985" /LENGTH=56 /DNA_ID=CAMNT_0015959481 /DNA_START=59 /DNA_END=225 /DNA_ORIENTATION=+